MKMSFITFFVIIWIFGCAVTSTTVYSTDASTPQPEQQADTVETSLDSKEIYVENPDLNNFIDTWNEGDLQKIRALFALGGRYFYGSDLEKFYQQDNIDPLVSGDTFASRVKDQKDSSLKIIGEPFGIYDKLAAFQYERKSDAGVQNGVTLLRLENGKVLLQVDIPGQDDQSAIDAAEKLYLTELMRVWNEADNDAAKSIYSPTESILSDEDLLQASWRDFKDPPKLKNLIGLFRGWNPEIIGQPLQVGNLILFPWHWYDKEYPVGYGIRVIQVDVEGITKDIRFVIRPWETESPFLTP